MIPNILQTPRLRALGGGGGFCERFRVLCLILRANYVCKECRV